MRRTPSKFRNRSIVVGLLLYSGINLTFLTAQDPPRSSGKNEFDSVEVERFKKLLATGGINRRAKVAANSFLPFNNRRTSEPGAVRVYKKDEKGKRLDPQPKGYPKTVDPKGFKPSSDEFVRVHEGIDFSSRDAKGIVRPLDFKAGVYGKVIEIGSSNGIGRITIEIDERKNRVEYLHTSKSYVKVGDDVKPDTLLGMTGDKGAKGQTHLHVQARNKDKAAIDPDELLLYAKKPPSERKMAEFFVPLKWREGLTPATADFDTADKAHSETPTVKEK